MSVPRALSPDSARGSPQAAPRAAPTPQACSPVFPSVWHIDLFEELHASRLPRKCAFCLTADAATHFWTDDDVDAACPACMARVPRMARGTEWRIERHDEEEQWDLTCVACLGQAWHFDECSLYGQGRRAKFLVHVPLTSPWQGEPFCTRCATSLEESCSESDTA